MVTQNENVQEENQSYLPDDSKRKNQVSTYVTDAEFSFLEKRKIELRCSRSDVLHQFIEEAVAEYRRRTHRR